MKENKKNNSHILMWIGIAIAIALGFYGITYFVLLLIPSSIEDGLENAFDTNAKNIYRTAQNQHLTDAINDKENKIYCYDSITTGALGSSSKNPLDLTMSDISYIITFNDNAEIEYFYMTNGTYQIEGNDVLNLKTTQGNNYNISCK